MRILYFNEIEKREKTAQSQWARWPSRQENMPCEKTGLSAWCH